MRTDLPPLPHWQTTPEDRPAAVRALKAAVRARLAAAGRPVAEVVAAMEERVRAEVAALAEAHAAGEPIWPEVRYDDIAAGTVDDATRALVRRRGCAIVRGHFPHRQALDWDRGIVEYVERNRFFETYRSTRDVFFKDIDERPAIYPIYWSPPQVEARQSERMATVQTFLNGFWRDESEGKRWFESGRDALYPDRIRRRSPGTSSNGLGSHIDPGTLDLWMTAENQRAFHHLWDGSVEAYDPWDAAYRTVGPQYPAGTICSAFRSFQGWTALSDMDHDQGVLYSIPVPAVMGYLLLRPFLDDVADDDMCGVDVGRAFAARRPWHDVLVDARYGIPDVRAGDSAWWHCDLVHGVAPVTEQRGWGNVMYIPAAPWCPRNERYAAQALEAFETGSSPFDFPEEHYERDWVGRPGVGDLNRTGRRSFGLA